jgi:hypothetical protein
MLSFVTSTYEAVITFSKAKVIEVLKFNQQDDGDRIFKS